MRTATVIFLLVFAYSVSAQETEPLYNPSAEAEKDLAAALQYAKQQNKHVLVQVGGNWCSWCYKLHNFMESNETIDSILKSDYVLIRINYSPENRNPGILANLDYPQRFGFPVLLVIDQKGVRLHTQDTALLEKDDSYDAEKLKRFLLSWNVAALRPETYEIRKTME